MSRSAGAGDGWPARRDPVVELQSLAEEVAACRACPRLVEWRERVAIERRPASRDETYWGRGVPGFGDPRARLVIVGLAPAAHGANRTGRMFTGDRSGDFLYAALHRAGYASSGVATRSDDGLQLRGAWITAAVRCAPPENRPAPDERARCASFLTRELASLRSARVLMALGSIAYEALRRTPALVGLGPQRWPRFGHGAEVPLAGGLTVLCSYHPSQRNVFTGLLDAAMLDAVLSRASALAGGGPEAVSRR